MGEQSSGKSTVAKIISFCSWVEKDVSIRQSLDSYTSDSRYFIERLETFHKMKGYFNEKSEIIYESDFISIHHTWNSFNIEWKNRYDYKRKKISYIPSERSTVILPEIEKVELPNNYLKSFLFDWFDARKNFPQDKGLSLLNIGIEYYYSGSNKENHIKGDASGYDILLSNASSGLQSVTPLIVMIDHLIHHIYNEEIDLSYELDEVKSSVSQMLTYELIIKHLYPDLKNENAESTVDILKDFSEKFAQKDEKVMPLVARYHEVRQNLFETHGTTLIIEEPEQNLFPATQKTLVYFLLESISGERDHNLILTTHSPYILYAVNNCIMAALVSDKLSEKEKDKIKCLQSKVASDAISIYEIKDGYIKKIQDQDGLIGKNFFDEQMKGVMDEYHVMLNRY